MYEIRHKYLYKSANLCNYSLHWQLYIFGGLAWVILLPGRTASFLLIGELLAERCRTDDSMSSIPGILDIESSVRQRYVRSDS